jgi:hypothetical protein
MSSNLTLKADGYTFSNGDKLSFHILKEPAVLSGDEWMALQKAHWNAPFLKKGPMTLALPTNGAQKYEMVAIRKDKDESVTVRDIVDAIFNYYNSPISRSDREALEQKGEYNRWNKHMFPNKEDWLKKINTYGLLRGDHIYYEGLHRLEVNLYSVCFGS